MNLVSELVTTQAQLRLLVDSREEDQLTTISENMEKITRRLRDNAFGMSLIPIDSLVIRFSRMVRDLSRELNKDVIFHTEGTETEIDKSIIERLTDPILHLLRNALDHGLELPEDRARAGKSRQGKIALKAYHSGGSVVIEISDDGAGINLEKVKRKAIQKGILDADTQLSDKEITDLIFLPGFSTAGQITGVSGRGVGMDVVKRNIADLRGDIEIVTHAGRGTTFVISLPLTLSIIEGLLVTAANISFILPRSMVRKCYEVETSLLDCETHRQVVLDGDRIPVLNLCEEFTTGAPLPALSQVITVSHQGNTFGLAVEAIVGEYQAVLKPLGNCYRDQDEFSGATILGDGSVALIIDPTKLIRKLLAA
jgi:two-component system chemotaxis sensor kinase CheA